MGILGQILFHFAFFVILGDILTSPQSSEITYFNFFFQNLILGSLKSKFMVKPQITIFSPKTASKSLLKVVDALKDNFILMKKKMRSSKNGYFAYYGILCILIFHMLFAHM